MPKTITIRFGRTSIATQLRKQGFMFSKYRINKLQIEVDKIKETAKNGTPAESLQSSCFRIYNQIIANVCDVNSLQRRTQN